MSSAQNKRATKPEQSADTTLIEPAPLPHPTLSVGSWPRVTEGFREVGHGHSSTTLQTMPKLALSSEDRVSCPLKAARPAI